MHRQAIIHLLEEYKSHHPEETDTTDRYMRFVSSYHDCFERSQPVGHVTGSAWLLNLAGTHVLLTHHRKLDIWVQLGGHADGETDPLSVAMREAQEESGIDGIVAITDRIFDIDIHKIPSRDDEPEHFHYDARFLLQVTSTDNFAISEESHALEWVEISRITEKTTEPSMLRMADKCQRR